MEWNVLFFQTLLLMLVASQVTNACSCHMNRFEEAMCPKRNKTVVRAKVLNAEDQYTEYTDGDAIIQKYDGRESYRLQLQNTYMTGPNKIEMNDSIFKTVAKIDEGTCGFTLNVGVDYLLIGDVTDKGEFQTNLCGRTRWESLSESQVNLFEGTGTAPNCDDENPIS